MTELSSSADHRSTSPPVSRYNVGGASNEATVEEGGVVFGVERLHADQPETLDVALEGAVGAPQSRPCRPRPCSTRPTVDRRGWRARATTTSRSATTVRHSSGASNEAATTRPFGASRDVTAYNSPAWKKNDDCASIPLMTSRHSPDSVSSSCASIRPQPTSMETSRYRPSSLAMYIGPRLGGWQVVEHQGSAAGSVPSRWK